MTAKIKREPMEPEEVATLVGKLIDSAQHYMDDRVTPARVTATDYYHGREFGNEEPGRSQVVINYVRQTIRRIVPSLMRIFTGPERYVEFRARIAGKEALALQQTDYINYIILEDNPGFQIIHDTLKDGLTRRTGVVKWGVEETSAPEETEYTGLEQMQVLALMMEPNTTVSGIEPDEAAGGGTWRCTVLRDDSERRFKLWSVPGEQVLWNEEARSFEDADIVDHTRDLPAFKLVEMGYDEDFILEHVGAAPSRNRLMVTESNAKRVDGGLQNPTSRPTVGDGDRDLTQRVRYDESYVYLNYTGKRVQMYKVCTIGEQHELLEKDGKPCIYPVSHRPFALFTPDPEPNTMIGLSPADDAMPTQKIQSQLMRGTLDSLSLALDPTTEVVDGMVSVADLMNTEMGRFIRVQQPGMMREVKHSFAGADALTVMQFMEEVGENDTGESKGSVGMDADALQSTAKNAIAAQMTMAQQRKEMIARTFAETMKIVYKGLLRLVVENQNKARVVRLRGTYQEVDPRGWDANMDVIVNVALGSGLPEEKIAGLVQVAAKQEQILVTQGPNNPLVKMSQYRNTLARIVELLGYKSAEEFFLPIDPEQEAAAAQAASQAPPTPSPEEIKAQTTMQTAQLQAQTEQMRMQLDMQARTAELEFRKQEAAMKLQQERELALLDLEMRERIEQMKHEGAHSREVTKATTVAGKAQLDAETKKETAAIGADAKVRAAEIQADTSRAGHDVDVHKAHVAAAVDSHATEVSAETARQKAVEQTKVAAMTAMAKGKTET